MTVDRGTEGGGLVCKRKGICALDLQLYWRGLYVGRARATRACLELVNHDAGVRYYKHFLILYTMSHGPCVCCPSQVNDNLRAMLLCEESENAGLYSEEERAQLLWRCFEHLCLGGPCCQNEVRYLKQQSGELCSMNNPCIVPMYCLKCVTHPGQNCLINLFSSGPE